MSKPPRRSPLTLGAYQKAAQETDHTGDDPQDGTLVAVLGIQGEAGDLATLFKKRIRDGDVFEVYPDQCAEELGDILWYMATLCNKLGLSLETIARDNLSKTKLRWAKTTPHKDGSTLLDSTFPVQEQFPRVFQVEFSEYTTNGRTIVALTKDGRQLGDQLTDNAHFDDGYRYHDAFHLAYAAILGWSPIVRRLLGCKRRSVPEVDEIEDGGRAGVIEEAVAAVVFEYAEKHAFLDNAGRVDSELLSMLTRLTSGLEVNRAAPGEWETAILQGYKIYRLLMRHRGGTVTLNLTKRTIEFRKPAKEPADNGVRGLNTRRSLEAGDGLPDITEGRSIQRPARVPRRRRK